jgi:Fe2+ or Zn2+ uptake regulation protein
VKFSRAQFYKTLKKLEDLKLIERVGSPRSARYYLLGEV